MATYWKINKDGTLEFDDTYEGPIELPQGVTSCRAMFAGKTLRPGCYLKDFDTSNVTDFEGMFKFCTLPADFNLPANFVTKSAKTMRQMFFGCHFQGGFIITQQFTVPKFCDCSKMFEKVEFPDEFIFSDNFKPFEAKSTVEMFKDAVIPEGVTFGEGYTVFSPVTDRTDMFKGAKLPFGISSTEDPTAICKCLFDRVGTNSTTASMDKEKLDAVKADINTSIAKRNVPDYAIDCVDFIAEEMRKYQQRGVEVYVSDKFLSRVPVDVDKATAAKTVRDLFEEVLLDLNVICGRYAGGGREFNPVEYLKEKFGDKYDLVPSASVNNCETKEDCDDLYNRLSTML